MRSWCRFLVLWGACLGVYLCAYAEQGVALPDKKEATLGMSRTNQSLLHGVLINYKNDLTLNVTYETAKGFASIQNGVGVWLVREALVKAGVGVNYMLGRQESADRRYTGMGNVPGSAMSYVWGEWQPIQDAVTVYGNFGNSWNSANGKLAQWGTTLGFPVLQTVNGFVDFSRLWGDQRYVQRFYGVNSSQATLSGYRPFNVQSSGTLYRNAQMGLVWSLDAQTDVIMAYGKSSASSFLMESPLLDRKSQAMSAVVLSRRFD
jgi:outer membrane scaffolding protein for murein synthesis (MipA/OmpV family)